MALQFEENEEVRSIFAKACKSFRDNLSADEKRDFVEYTQPDLMLQGIKEQYQNHPVHNHRLTSCLKKVDSFAKRLTPYFAIIDIFVQTNPQYAGLVWGAIRLVFQLSSHYVTFLDKLGTLFERIEATLPVYERYYSILRSRSKDRQPLSSRLLTSLAIIYVDVLQFCQEACNLFCTRKGLRFRAIIARDLSWKPFDMRFGAILENMSQHSKLFELEMKVAHSASIFSEFDDLHAKFRTAAQQAETLERERTEEVSARIKREEGEAMRQKGEQITRWIDAPNWDLLFKDVLLRRAVGTGEWIFEEPLYRRWEATRIPYEQDEKPVLVFLGKPGYGKTYLCANLIERFSKSSAATTLGQSSQDQFIPSLGYYFFDSQRPKESQPIHAFRAILAQTLHTYRFDKEIIDITSLNQYRGGIYSEGDGHQTASLDEILALLSYVFQRYQNYTLVFDGIDECSDPPEFFRLLRVITSRVPSTARSGLSNTLDPSGATDRASCKIALFSRPEVKFAPFIRNQSMCISLDAKKNFGDIKFYLGLRLQDLVDDELIAQERHPGDLVEDTSLRADGMFLWARLLIDYLHCEGLTLQDRTDALNNLVFLEGLDQLYNAILVRLHQRLPKKARINVRRLFQWTAGAERALHIDELRVATTINRHRSSIEKDDFPNLDQVLTRISGSLLELDVDQNVRFIHSSVGEYLFKVLPNIAGKAVLDDFIIHKTQTERFLASSCLLYLTQHLATGPLSGSSQVTPDRYVVARKYPLLRYSLQYWTQHSSMGLLEGSSKIIDFEDISEESSYKTLFEQINEFIACRQRVTTWIEASWLFELPPSLGQLPVVIQDLMSSSATCKNHNMIVQMHETLQAFNRDLGKLDGAWGTVLASTPNDIWEPSIQAFTPSDYWVNTHDAILSKMVSEDKGHILVKSQVSDTASEMGLIKLFVPNAGMRTSSSQDLESCALGWKVVYEVWSMSTVKIRFKLAIDIPQDQIEMLLSTATYGSLLGRPRLKDLEFEFPVSISSSLRKILIVGCLIDIQDVPHSKLAADPSLNCKSTWQILDLWPNEGLDSDPGCIPSGYGLLLSPTGQDVLFIRRLNPDSFTRPPIGEVRGPILQEPTWKVSIFHQRSSDNRVVPVNSIYLRTSQFHLNNDLVRRVFCFHPSLPVIAFIHGDETLVWSFSVPDSKPVKVFQSALVDVSFSTCGRFLTGSDLSRSDISRRYLSRVDSQPFATTAVINVEDKLPGLVSYISPQSTCQESSSVAITIPSNSSSITKSSTVIRPTHITSNRPTFRLDENNDAELSVLQQGSHSVVLQTVSESGAARYETLSLLPTQFLGCEAELIVRPDFGGQDLNKVRIALNKKEQRFYSFSEPSDTPAVLERTCSSIPVFHVEGQKSIGLGDGNQKRLLTSESDCNVVKRRARMTVDPRSPELGETRGGNLEGHHGSDLGENFNDMEDNDMEDDVMGEDYSEDDDMKREGDGEEG